MIIELLDEKMECENAAQLQIVLDKANAMIEQANLTLSHVMIDGVEVYENFEDYILNNMETIQTIKLITRTTKELIQDVFQSNQQYLSNLSTGLPHLSDKFYQSPADEAWSELLQFIEGVQWLFQLADSLDQLQKQNNYITEWNEHLIGYSALNQSLSELLSAMENKDSILMADLLQYEIKPNIDKLLSLTNQFLEHEVVNDELN